MWGSDTARVEPGSTGSLHARERFARALLAAQRPTDAIRIACRVDRGPDSIAARTPDPAAAWATYWSDGRCAALASSWLRSAIVQRVLSTGRPAAQALQHGYAAAATQVLLELARSAPAPTAAACARELARLSAAAPAEEEPGPDPSAIRAQLRDGVIAAVRARHGEAGAEEVTRRVILEETRRALALPPGAAAGGSAGGEELPPWEAGGDPPGEGGEDAPPPWEDERPGATRSAGAGAGEEGRGTEGSGGARAKYLLPGGFAPSSGAASPYPTESPFITPGPRSPKDLLQQPLPEAIRPPPPPPESSAFDDLMAAVRRSSIAVRRG